jgi:hypothetical protein
LRQQPARELQGGGAVLDDGIIKRRQHKQDGVDLWALVIQDAAALEREKLLTWRFDRLADNLGLLKQKLEKIIDTSHEVRSRQSRGSTAA